jgi:hypothetical protein
LYCSNRFCTVSAKPGSAARKSAHEFDVMEP